MQLWCASSESKWITKRCRGKATGRRRWAVCASHDSQHSRVSRFWTVERSGGRECIFKTVCKGGVEFVVKKSYCYGYQVMRRTDFWSRHCSTWQRFETQVPCRAHGCTSRKFASTKLLQPNAAVRRKEHPKNHSNVILNQERKRCPAECKAKEALALAA